jgi:hypothetical protein
MKTVLAWLGVMALFTGHLFAQADVIIKKRALEIRNQNNVQQGIAAPTPPAQAAQPATAPVKNAATTPVQQSLAKVKTDLAAIKTGTPATAAQKQQIAKDLIAVAQGASKPSQATATSLANSLADAFAEKPLADNSTSRLMSNLAAVLNPARIPPAQMQAIYADIQAIFQANGMARKDAVKIVDEVKAVGVETQKSGS